MIEGVTPASLQWVYDNVGKNVVAVWERCRDMTKFIAGTPCSSGLLLSCSSIGGQDGGIFGISLQLQGEECSEPFYVYDVSGIDFPAEPDV
jgi:hypothetical protein